MILKRLQYLQINCIFFTIRSDVVGRILDVVSLSLSREEFTMLEIEFSLLFCNKKASVCGKYIAFSDLAQILFLKI